MRYMTLEEMLDGLRIEARISQSAAHGLTLRDPHTYLLNRIQDDLYANWEWPHLKLNVIKDISEGTRYTAFPDGMIFESTETLFGLNNDDNYYPMTQGIGVEHYNVYDPTVVSERNYPLLRWQTYVPPEGDTNFNMIELWPVPDRDTKIMFKGRRSCKKLVADTDVSTIDGLAIVLHAAAELLAGQKAEDASLKLSKAQERVRTLKIRQSGGDNRSFNLGGGTHIRSARVGLDYIPMKST